MVLNKNKINISELNNSEDQESDSDSSDVSDSDESDSPINEDATIENSDPESDNENEECEEEEDEVIKAIRKENEKQREHPPVIICEDHVVDISFHPCNDLLAVASITGDVLLYKYTNNENTLLNTLELHTKSCRDIEFNDDGKFLYSVAQDKAIMISDVENGSLKRFIENAHNAPIYCTTVIDDNLIATGKLRAVIFHFITLL